MKKKTGNVDKSKRSSRKDKGVDDVGIQLVRTDDPPAVKAEEVATSSYDSSRRLIHADEMVQNSDSESELSVSEKHLKDRSLRGSQTASSRRLNIKPWWQKDDVATSPNSGKSKTRRGW